MKKFNNEGNKKFEFLMKDFLRDSSNVKSDYKNKYKSLFEEIITDKKNLENLPDSQELVKNKFKNRFEYGKYLFGVLQNCNFSKINRDKCLWNYISCFFLEDFISSSNKPNRYIWMPKWHDTKRLLARTPWLLYYINRENSLFSLCTSLNEHSNMCEQFVARQELLRNTSVGELCQKLYYNPETKKLRKNAAKHEKDDKLDGWHSGVIHPRLTGKLGKLYKIYDLWSLSASDLEKLIGEEFKHWDKTP